MISEKKKKKPSELLKQMKVAVVVVPERRKQISISGHEMKTLSSDVIMFLLFLRRLAHNLKM